MCSSDYSFIFQFISVIVGSLPIRRDRPIESETMRKLCLSTKFPHHDLSIKRDRPIESPETMRKLCLFTKFPHHDSSIKRDKPIESPKTMGKLCFSTYFHTMKLGEIAVFYAV